MKLHAHRSHAGVGVAAESGTLMSPASCFECDVLVMAEMFMRPEEEGPHQNPTLLTPSSQTSSHQNCEKHISVVKAPQSVVACYSSREQMKTLGLHLYNILHLFFPISRLVFRIGFGTLYL